MNAHQFWNAVPKPVRILACATVGVAVLVGLVAGAVHGRLVGQSTASPVLESLVGIGIGLLVGSLIAIWFLCLGYVYADARRRAMPPVLWILIAALIPNLLGFLLYFALRRPIALPCANCGRAIATEQRFCSWCGFDKLSSASGSARPQTASTGLDSSPA
jgi:hypothetical protein